MSRKKKPKLEDVVEAPVVEETTTESAADTTEFTFDAPQDVAEEEVVAEDKIDDAMVAEAFPTNDPLTSEDCADAEWTEPTATEPVVEEAPVVVDAPPEDLVVETTEDTPPVDEPVEESPSQEIDIRFSMRPDDIEACLFADQADANRIRLEAEADSELGRERLRREAKDRKAKKKRQELENKHGHAMERARKALESAVAEAKKAGVE